jgi:hypothetical protein
VGESSTVTILLALLGIVAAVFVVDRILLAMEKHGWIDYRRTYPGRMNSEQIGPAFLQIGSLLEPGKRHVVEQKTAVRTEREDSGDKPPDDRRPGSLGL